MSLRKCEKLSARMIEKVVTSAPRRVALASPERPVLINSLLRRARRTLLTREWPAIRGAWLYSLPRLSDGSHSRGKGAAMQQHRFGRMSPVSALTLGGGGLGMVWGETTFEECVLTVHAAVEAGITLFDLAPRYG